VSKDFFENNESIVKGCKFFLVEGKLDSEENVVHRRYERNGSKRTYDRNGLGIRRSFIVSNMNSGNRHRGWAWLLCALLFWLTTNPPHCDLCDDVSFTVASAQPSILKHSHPVAPDNCNGICTCCGFYGLPRVEQALVPLNAAPARVVPESPRPAFAPRSTIFRPPRIVAS
jgi:hypothetical protein